VDYRHKGVWELIATALPPATPALEVGAAKIIGGPYNAGRMILAALSPTNHMSPLTLVVLAIVFIASVWVYGQLVRRETSHRRMAILGEWARSHDLRLTHPADAQDAGDFLTPLGPFNPRIELLIHDKQLALMQVRTGNSPSASAPAATAPHWHLLLRRFDQNWPTTALRPTAHTFSIVDLFGMTSFPSLGATQRFVVFGGDAEAARALSESAPALLPPDVGLLLHGEFLILDFTSRHFDQIEFERMIDLAEQLSPRLAAPGAAGRVGGDPSSRK